MEAVQALTGWWAKATDVVAAGEKEVSSGSKWSASVQIFRNPRGESWGRSRGGRGGEKAPEVEMLMIPAGIGRSRMRSMLLKKRNTCGSGEGDGSIDWRRAERGKRLGDVHGRPDIC